jgi:glutamate formiminotransferase/formiminotetrahydrofolate cyclodeaminase
VGERLGEAGIPVYLYEHAATAPHRRNLAAVRAGEYEGLEAKMADPDWIPDFGPARPNRRAGATAVGARDFLIAYNVNLNTTSTRRANAIAFDVREKGRIKREGDPLTGDIVRDVDGEPMWIPGSLRKVKAIGWFIEEYGIAQISMNLTDISVTPVHVAFDEVAARAEARGLRATGSEIVGMVPLRALLDAGRHYLHKQRLSAAVPDEQLVTIAVKSMGLDDLRPFDPDAKIIEYRLKRDNPPMLIDLTAAGYVHEVAAGTPSPGGGSAAASAGALGAALGTMVANLAAHKRGWDDRWEEFATWAERGKELQDRLLTLVDDDARAFDAVMAAYRLPKATDEEREARAEAVAAATRAATQAPLAVMESAGEAFDVLAFVADEGPESSVSDAGVGALLAGAAVRGAHLNVLVNAAGSDDLAGLLERAADLEEAAGAAERRILEAVRARIEGG